MPPLRAATVLLAHAGHVDAGQVAAAGRPGLALLVVAAFPFLVGTLLSLERRNGAVRNVVLFSAAAGFVHAVVTPEHAQEGFLVGLFTLAVTLAQMSVVVAGLNRPTRRLWAVTAAGNVAVLAVWVLSRTAGLPLGPEPWTPEPVGLLDLACAAYEVAVVTGALALASRPAPVPATVPVPAT